MFNKEVSRSLVYGKGPMDQLSFLAVASLDMIKCYHNTSI